MKKIETLSSIVNQILSTYITVSAYDYGEYTITVNKNNIHEVLTILKNNPDTLFEQCIDVCGVDYLEYKNEYVGDRFAVVYHLLSVKNNFRIRVKAYIPDGDNPNIDSVQDIFNSANWCEREVFDLYGITFNNHPDLRRILTDYGFVGHPFRKDFPLSGYVEMKYNVDQKRVVYQPVTIPPREITPKVIRKRGA